LGGVGRALRELDLGASIAAGTAAAWGKEADCDRIEPVAADGEAEEEGVATIGSERKRKNLGTASMPTTMTNAPSSAGIRKLERP
jgi:hypothetical protein